MKGRRRSAAAVASPSARNGSAVPRRDRPCDPRNWNSSDPLILPRSAKQRLHPFLSAIQVHLGGYLVMPERFVESDAAVHVHHATIVRIRKLTNWFLVIYVNLTRKSFDLFSGRAFAQQILSRSSELDFAA